MQKATTVLMVMALAIIGFLFLNKIKFVSKPTAYPTSTLINPVPDLSASALSSQKNQGGSGDLSALPPLGNPNAPIKIFIFADYQCPFCKKLFDEAEIKIKNEFVNKGLVVMYFKDYAFLGEESVLAANAARCAHEQGLFWIYHDLLFSKQGVENSGAFSKANLKSFVNGIELDAKKFNDCVDAEKYRSIVMQETQSAQNLGVKGTPYLSINNKVIEGAYPYAQIRAAILQELQNLQGAKLNP